MKRFSLLVPVALALMVALVWPHDADAGGRYRDGRGRVGRDGEPSEARSNGLTTGLVAYWPLATNSLDASGHGHNGTDTSITYADGAATFGAGSLITFAATDLQPGSSGDFSVAFMFTGDSSASGGLFQVVLGSTSAFGRSNVGLVNSGSADLGRMTTQAEANVDATVAGPWASWNIAVFTYTDGTVDAIARWYVNGVLADETIMAFTPNVGSVGRIGQNSTGTAQRYGKLKNIAAWSRELSATDVANLVAAGGNPL